MTLVTDRAGVKYQVPVACINDPESYDFGVDPKKPKGPALQEVNDLKLKWTVTKEIFSMNV